MSDFADYVEKQQSKRLVSRASPSDSGYSTAATTTTEDHAELDILDTFDLSETSSQVRLRHLLLDDDPASTAETLQQLANLLQSRILEGHGETLFDLGSEDNGESMKFTKEQWDVSLDRISRAAGTLKADVRILMTRNVGVAEEVGGLSEKGKACTGKLMIRQAPETVEDVIETRIAVVGNGTFLEYAEWS